MNPWILSIGGLVLLSALGWFFLRQLRVVLHTIPDPQPRDTPHECPNEGHVSTLRARQAVQESRIEDLFQAVADGIDHVERNEKRVRGIVTGAKRRFEAEGYVDAGVDAEAATLPLDDATGGGNEGLPPVPDDVAPVPIQGIPGTVPPEFWRDLNAPEA